MSNKPLSVEEHVHGDTVWVAVRARGADWSWLTPEEAVRLSLQWLERWLAPEDAARLGQEWLDKHGKETSVPEAAD